MMENCLLQLVAISVDLELATVVVTLERDEVSEGADSAALVLPESWVMIVSVK